MGSSGLRSFDPDPAREIVYLLGQIEASIQHGEALSLQQALIARATARASELVGAHERLDRIVSYALTPNDPRDPGGQVTCQRTHGLDPKRAWAVRVRGRCLSKSNLAFNLEPQPSNRDDPWLDDHRFPTARDAELAFAEYQRRGFPLP